MRAIARPWLIRKGYDGMTFFGRIITHSKEEAARINTSHASKDTVSSIIKNHEMIHLYQARSTHDSWFCFYILYGWYWLLACRYWRRLIVSTPSKWRPMPTCTTSTTSTTNKTAPPSGAAMQKCH